MAGLTDLTIAEARDALAKGALGARELKVISGDYVMGWARKEPSKRRVR